MSIILSSLPRLAAYEWLGVDEDGNDIYEMDPYVVNGDRDDGWGGCGADRPAGEDSGDSSDDDNSNPPPYGDSSSESTYTGGNQSGGGDSNNNYNSNAQPTQANTTGVMPKGVNQSNFYLTQNTFNYQRTFNLPTGANGVLVQKMTITDTNGFTKTYYEAWQVSSGQSPSDYWLGALSSENCVTMYKGEIQFYPNATLANNFPELRPNSVTEAGNLHASNTAPSNWTETGVAIEMLAVSFQSGSQPTYLNSITPSN